MSDLTYTNTFIHNPYLLYFDSDGDVEHVFDQWRKIPPREMIEAFRDYTDWFLENYPTNDHVDFENMKIEKAHEKWQQEYRKKRDAELAEEKKNKDKRDVYVIRDIHRGCFKIGIAINIETRLKQLRTANAGIELIRFFSGGSEDERTLHRHFTKQGKRIDGEWFSLGTSDLEHIESYFTAKIAPEQ